jgi:FkbM family methyltransferase
LKQVRGFFLPDDETHLVPFLENGPEFAGGPTYQLHKLMAAMPYVRNFRHAVDVGAHCGLWSRPLSVMFRHVTAFEPIEQHRECFSYNVRECTPHPHASVRMCPYALGDRDGVVSLHTGENSSGDTYIVPHGEHVAAMKTLDSFGLVDVDLLKIDCEGFEVFSVQGGAQTIRKYRPAMIVEQKPGHGKKYGISDTAAVELLQSWGATVRQVISGDFILSW